MIDKKLMTSRFLKNLKTYDFNAVVQKNMAQQLIKMLPENKFNMILEVGCGTGILTQYAVKNIAYAQYMLNDIVQECGQYVSKIIPEGIFVCGDIEEINFNSKFDLIISNACLQWCCDFEKTVLKLADLLDKDGILAFSVFGEKNLTEIRQITNSGLDYCSQRQIKKIFADYDIISIRQDTEKIYFEKPVDILKHLKYTGVNALTETSWTKSKIIEFEKKYNDLFSKNGKVCATYDCIYAVIKKIG